MVVKADGLALGKGVVVCRDLEACAIAAIADAMESRKFGAAGARVVLEEVLHGEELSFFALCNGDDAIPFGALPGSQSQFSTATKVPTPAAWARIRRCRNFLHRLKSDCSTKLCGRCCAS